MFLEGSCTVGRSHDIVKVIKFYYLLFCLKRSMLPQITKELFGVLHDRYHILVTLSLTEKWR